MPARGRARDGKRRERIGGDAKRGRNEAGAGAPPTVDGDFPDRAPDLPGAQLNDPDERLAAGVTSRPIRPQRRGGGPK